MMIDVVWVAVMWAFTLGVVAGLGIAILTLTIMIMRAGPLTLTMEEDFDDAYGRGGKWGQDTCPKIHEWGENTG